MPRGLRASTPERERSGYICSNARAPQGMAQRNSTAATCARAPLHAPCLVILASRVCATQEHRCMRHALRATCPSALAGTGERGELSIGERGGRSIIDAEYAMPLVTQVSHLVPLVSREPPSATSHLFDVYSTLLSTRLMRERERERARESEREEGREGEREKWC